MEPKKTIKKHYIIDHESELMELLSHISDSALNQMRTGRENMMGSANWVVCFSEVADIINSMYEVDEIGDLRVDEIGDLRVEDVLPTDPFTADTWTQDET